MASAPHSRSSRGTPLRLPGLAIALFLAIPAGVARADEAPLRAVMVPGFGSVRFPVPPEWSVSTPVVARPDGGAGDGALDRTASFEVTPDGGSQCTMSVAMIWRDLPDPDFNGPGALRALVDRMALAVLDASIESRYTLREMRGALGGGYSFSLRARVPRRKSEAYLTSGAFGVGNLLLRFTVLSPQPDPPEVAEALRMIAGARLDEEPPPAPPEEASR